MKIRYLTTLVSLLLLAACSTNPLTGKKELDPQLKDALLTVVQVEASTLAADYLQNGQIDYKHDLIQGALSQVYTLEKTATPAVKSAIANLVGRVISDPAMAGAVSDSAVHIIEKAQDGGLTKNAAIAEGISLLQATLPKFLGSTP